MIKQVRLVVVPSGKTRVCGHPFLGSARFLISSIVYDLFFEFSRETRIGCVAKTSLPRRGIFAFASLETLLGNPRTKKTQASKNEE